MTKKILYKALTYLLIYHVLSFALSALLEARFMQFLSIQHIVSSDLTYNDLFYRNQHKRKEDKAGRKHKEEILLINTAQLDPQNFRSELAQLIRKLEGYQPKAIGLDINFSNRTDSSTSKLLETLQSYKNIVCAFKKSARKGENLSLPMKTLKGDVDFPDEQHSLRFYKGGERTFAYQLFKLIRKNAEKSEVATVEKFPIAYSSIHDGIVDFDNISSTVYSKNYKTIDAKAFLGEEAGSQHYGASLKGSVLIIGHLGTGPNDIEDKHAVPTDTNSLVNRASIMPGAAIHANALSNLLDGHIYHEPNSLLVEIVLNLLMLLMILLILRHPLKIVMFAGLLVFSIIWIWLAIYLMEFNIYIQVGTTLIELMILEEFVETAEPFVDGIRQRIQKKRHSKVKPSKK